MFTFTDRRSYGYRRGESRSAGFCKPVEEPTKPGFVEALLCNLAGYRMRMAFSFITEIR